MPRSRRAALWVSTVLILATVLVPGVASQAAAATPCAPYPGDPEDRFPNPLHQCPTADPGIWRVGSTWYTYSTTVGNTQFDDVLPIRTSTDLRTWTEVGHIFPVGRKPAWASPTAQYWGPQVYRIRGRYVAYFSAENFRDGRHWIGVATADNPEGPWTPRPQPLDILPGRDFSVIDPSFFHDPTDGRNYLLWKNNTNALAMPRPTHIMIQRLSANGLELARSSQPHAILVNDQSWEGDVVEAPGMEYRAGRYYLFYSGNTVNTRRYAVGVARSSAGTPTRGFRKFRQADGGRPILASDDRFVGPGGQDVVRGPNPGEWLMFYHGLPQFEPFINRGRFLMMDRIRWGTNGWPRVHDGTPSN